MRYLNAAAFLLVYLLVGSAAMTLLYGPIFIFGLWWLPVPLTLLVGGLVYLIADEL